MNDRRFYVYVGEHPVSGAPCYVGKGSNGRMLDHNSRLRTGRHLNKHLQAIYNKHGPIAWSKVRENLLEVEAFETEVVLITHFGRGRKGLLCNLSDGGDGTAGAVRSPEVRARISAKHKGKKLSAAHIAHNRTVNLGRKHTDEWRLRMSKKKKGKPKSPEWRAAIGRGNFGKSRGKGIPKSPEHNAKVGAALKAFHAQRRAAVGFAR